jgi:hypothetical protein
LLVIVSNNNNNNNNNNNTKTADQFVGCSDCAVCQIATALLCLVDRSEASQFPFRDYVLFSNLYFISSVSYLNCIIKVIFRLSQRRVWGFRYLRDTTLWRHMSGFPTFRKYQCLRLWGSNSPVQMPSRSAWTFKVKALRVFSKRRKSLIWCHSVISIRRESPVSLEALPNWRSSYVPSPVAVRVCAQGSTVEIQITAHRNPIGRCMPEPPVSVVAQQYSSSSLVSLRFYFHMENFGSFQKVIS